MGYQRIEEIQHAVLWQDGTLADLGTLPGGQISSATAIDDRTGVVGRSRIDADGSVHAFRWRDGVMSPLGSTPARATDINNRGQIVGDADGAAVRWWYGMRSPLTTESSAAEPVNRYGTVAGMHWGPSGSGSFVWKHGRFIVIPPPVEEFAFLQAYGIKRRHAGRRQQQRRLVREHGKPTILPALTRASGAYAITDHGVIAGKNPTTAEGLVPHAVIWTR